MSEISHIPKGFTSVTPYIIVHDAERLVKFLEEAFDAEFIDLHREDGNLRHFAARIFGSMIEGSQGSKEWDPRPTSVHMYVPDCDAVCQKAVDAGGKLIYEVEDQEYGERSGGVEDPCGNHWYIATQKVDMYPDAE